ncbi:MAG TPA: DUF2071 domain-containing protein [Terriglobales bacterium]|nr:DUF2071 domain-containing protein [Terriglobales bacterium]
MQQTWHDLLFAHWPLGAKEVRAAMPGAVSQYLDTFDDKAWVGVIPFWMSNVRGRFLPPVPSASRFPELNVRTYVTKDGKPGVYFFSLDAASRLAVVGARAAFALNYFHAEMRCDVTEQEVNYASRRLRATRPASFIGSYAPSGPVFRSVPGTLEHFLTERYCLYAERGGKILRADIHHLPWPLQAAEADIVENSMASASGMLVPDLPPLLHFAKRMDVLVWWPDHVR